jgi:hypothetical protein
MFVFAYPHSDASVVGEKTSKFSVKDFLDGFLPSADAAARSLEASGGRLKGTHVHERGDIDYWGLVLLH